MSRSLPAAVPCALLLCALLTPGSEAQQSSAPDRPDRVHLDPLASARLGPTSPNSAAEYYRLRTRALERFDAGAPGAADALEELTRRYPADAELWYRLALLRVRAGDAEGALEAGRRLLEVGFWNTASIEHRIARLFALTARPDSALVWLERALDDRYDERPSIAQDPAFEALRGDPRFRRLAGAVDGDELGRDEGWRRDLDYLLEETRRMHVGRDRPAFSAAFEAEVSALKERVPELSNDRMVVELQRLMATLGDGHTGIYGPAPESPLTFRAGTLPLLFYLFADGLYVVDGAGEAERWVGSRVVAFGPRSADEVLGELPRWIHGENAMTVTWLGVRFQLPRLAFLEAVGAAADLTEATLTLRDPEGREHRVTFEGGDHQFRRKLRPPPGAPSAPPLYLRNVDRSYGLEPLEEADALYFQFNQVRDAESGPSIAEFADSLAAALERTDAATLIVDVRHNNGGNNGLLRPLIRRMVWWEQEGDDHRIFVLTGRNTFSAAQNFVNRMERWTDAVFVGEPSASMPNFPGEETSLVLPYSRVRGSISNRYWQDSDPTDRRSWIAPDVPVSLTAEDYFSNRDPVLEAVLGIVGG